MEANPAKLQKEPDAMPYFKRLLDGIRKKSLKAEDVLDELGYIDGTAEAVQGRLDRAFYAAIMIQRDAIMSRDTQALQFANEVSYLTYHMGYHNEYLPARDYPDELKERNFVSGGELKLLQVKNMQATLQSLLSDAEARASFKAASGNSMDDYEIKAEAELRLAAVQQYATTNQIDVAANAIEDDRHDSKSGGMLKRSKEVIMPLVTKTAAAITLTAMTLIATSNASHAAESNPIDDETYDPDDAARKTIRKLANPIALAPPQDNNFQPPVRVEASPPPAKKPDGSIKIAAPADNNFKPPMIVEASPGPNINTIPNVPNTPPAAPKPAIERAPIPEVIVDPGLAGETMWKAEQLEQIKANLQVYLEVQAETGVPWEVMAALHDREYGLKVENPSNGQGIYQLYSTGEYFAPGVVSLAEFKHQTILAANFLKGKALDNSRVGGPMDYSNPDKIKDTLFSYNGRAAQYFEQAARLGFALGAEGSPYVMNMADDRRNSDLNPGWGQILVDNGPLGKANKRPGAWPLIEGLRKINQISRDRIAAQYAAEDAAAAENNAKKVIQKPELQRKETANWVFPVAGGYINSPYGQRGPAFHDGIDSPANVGSDFLAMEDGEVIEHRYEDVTGQMWCIKALEGVGYTGPLKDPVQKTIFVKHLIGDDVYVSRYDHLSEFSANVGDIVKAGQPVGKIGSSGCSTGGHAHVGMQKNGQSINPAELFH